MKKDLIIIGGGGLFSIVAEIIELYFSDKYKICGYLAKEHSKNIKKYEYLGTDQNLKKVRKNIDYAINCVGAIKSDFLRNNIYKNLKKEKFNLVNIIHPQANIYKSVLIGEGNIIMQGVSIGTNVKINNNIIIYPNTVIEHDSIIYDNVHIAPGVNIAGNVILKKNVFMGIGATVIQNVKVGDNVTVGAGTVIIKNIAADSKVVGNPARLIK